MKYWTWASLLLILAAFTAFGQSGRKVDGTPTPTPPDKADEPDYSESKPRLPLITRNPNKYPRADGTIPNVSLNEQAGPVTDPDVVKVETNLVTIPVSVFDRNGLYIPNLTQENFKIFEDDKEQEIAYFAKTDKPFTVVLLIDTSPSTSYKIEEIHQAAMAFVENLGTNDSVMVIEFSRKYNVLTNPTNDRKEIFKAIKKAKFGDGTSLYDAVDQTLQKKLSKISGRKAVVLFTDGVDTTSEKSNYYKTVEMSEEADALIFPIYYNTFDNRKARLVSLPTFPGSNNIPFPGSLARGESAEEYALGKQYLEDLAYVTGGRVFRPDATPGGLTAAFQGIAEELRRQYSIGYVPNGESKIGQRKQIKVRVNRPNLILRARDSYIVGGVAAQAEEDKAKTAKDK